MGYLDLYFVEIGEICTMHHWLSGEWTPLEGRKFPEFRRTFIPKPRCTFHQVARLKNLTWIVAGDW